MPDARFHGNDRIGEYQEVGPAARLLDGIFSRMAPVEVGPGGGGQVPAGREAPNADSRRIDMPLLGAGANRANRSLGVLQRRRMMIARSDAILEHKASHADRVKPFGDLLAL